MAFRLNGTGQYISAGNVLNPTVEMTVSVWIRPNNQSGRMEIISKESGTTGYEIHINDGTIEWGVFQGNYQIVLSTTTLAANTWHHICGVRTSTQLLLYINGTLNNTATASGTPSSNTNPLVFGKGSNQNSRWYGGSIEDIRVYNRALSAGEVLSLYTCKGSDSLYQGLVGRWPLNEESSGYGVGSYFINHQYYHETNNAQNLTMTYNIPSDLQGSGSSYFLVICAGGIAGVLSGSNAQPSSCTYRSNNVPKLGGSNSSDLLTVRAGSGVFMTEVTPGWNGTIVVTFGGTCSNRFVQAFIVSSNSVVSGGSNSVASYNNTNTISYVANRLVILASTVSTTNTVTAVANDNANTPGGHNAYYTQVGTTGSFMVSTLYAIANGSTSGVGVSAPGVAGSSSITWVGAEGSNRSIYEVSDNKFQTAAYGGGVYEESILRRKQYWRING